MHEMCGGSPLLHLIEFAFYERNDFFERNGFKKEMIFLQRNALCIIYFAKFDNNTIQIFRKIKILNLIWYQLKTECS